MLPIREGAVSSASLGGTAAVRVLNPLATSLPAERILVIRLGALGDVARTRFAFAAVRELYPRARIDWLVEDHAAPGLDGVADLDGIVTIPRRRLRFGQPGSALRDIVLLVRQLRAIIRNRVVLWSESSMLERSEARP